MEFASDNTSGVPQPVLDALVRANAGYAMGYGADAVTDRVQALVRELFEAPQAEVRLVATGTAANALALAVLAPPWGAIWCHAAAHVDCDECGAPEFFTGGAKLVLVPGAHGRIAPETLEEVLTRAGRSVHQVQPAALSLSNLTEAGTVYDPDTLAALCAVARRHGLGVHLDGARFANALVATGATPAQASWKAGVDVLCLGGTKNGLMGAEAVVIFDPDRAAEFDLRRKRAGHLFSKHRYLAAQMEAWLTDGLWLDLAARANAAAGRLTAGLAALPGVRLRHPVEGNLAFVDWPETMAARLRAGGAVFHDAPASDGGAGARLVASWDSGDDGIERFLALARG
ncbi:MAG: low specificity L-threonine aldolase [Rhodobacteraceae bacterium]|nr:low specificity L-threonine aldolase [Paracoccaceae bacterium]